LCSILKILDWKKINGKGIILHLYLLGVTLINLLELYVKLAGLILLGFIFGRKLPPTSAPRLGKYLFWIGVPVSIIAFLRQADLSGQIWMAAVIAHLAVLCAAFLAAIAIKIQSYFQVTLTPSTQCSLILAAMVGNTGYLGFPVTLAIVGKEYFAWALFYDLLGSLFAAYGLGVALAAYFSNNSHNYQRMIPAILLNPALWSFGFGLLFRQITIPTAGEFWLEKLAWSSIALSIILIGMRISQLKSWQKFPQAAISLIIKMLIVPLIFGSLLPFFGVTGLAARVVVLQMAMPPAFATLVIAETFDLDRDLAVTTLALGVILLLITLPLWLWLF
jgi:predicted permease